MRITIESAGFTDAGDACRAANQVAAMVTETLAGKLGGFGGMAGNDATSATFAGSYDAAARQALDTLTELTHAFIGLGRLISTTGANHHAAEVAAVCGSGMAGLPCDPPPARDPYDHVSPADPPTCLGGQEPSFGTIDRWILDHVEGFVWPGADVALLRGAAAAWRGAALSVDHLDHHVDNVAQLLARQRSPEIPVALDVLAGVRTLIRDAALGLTDLGQACEDYATAVEEAHDRTRAILAEIGQMIVEGAVLSVLVAGFTGGLGGGAAAGAVIARITAHAPHFRALQSTLQIAASTSATRARAARDGLRVVRERAEKLARVGARNERGEMKNPLGWGGRREPGWLKGHEVPPGHTLERHVGKTIEELMERARTRGRGASSFNDAASAEQFIDGALSARQSSITSWLKSGTTDKLILDVQMDRTTGITVLPDGSRLERTAVKVILIPSSKLGERWHILTAYPN